MTPIRVALFMFTLAFVLSGCVTPEPRIVTQEVIMPVTVACTLGERQEQPVWSDNTVSIPAAKNPGERIKLLLLGLNQRDRWINYLEGFYSAC